MPSLPKKVLYISYDGMTDPLGQSQVIPYLAGIAAAGYQISLMSFEKKERFEKNAPLVSALLAQKNIAWIPLFYTKKPPVFSTLWDISRLIAKATELHHLNNFALVHCRSYISALAGLRLKRKFGVKFIFDMRGFWADERVEGQIWNLSNPLYRTIYKFFKNKERQFFEQADYTISLTDHARDIIHSWKKIKNNPIPIQVVPCCADLSLFDYHNISEEKAAELKNQLSITNSDFIISYLGSIGTWYMLNEMLDFFKEIQTRKPGAKFLFITPDEPAHIERAAAQKGISASQLIIRSAARAEVPLFLSLCALSVFFIRPTFSKTASSPTKQGEVMGMGIPLICNSNVGDTDRIVEDTGCGAIARSFSHEGYEQVLSGLDKILHIDRAHIRAGAEKYYSLQNGIKKYLFVYQNVLSK
jgi:glycosyltransferase involved in cell wall biosynthesis